MLQNSKDLLIKGLSQFPEITLYPPNGGYFFIINIEKLIPYIPKRHFYKDCNENRELKDGLFEELDKPDYTAGQACFYWLAKEIGINIIPLDSFYENEGKNAQEIKGGKLMRVSVCTKESSIAAALEKLGNKLKLLKTNIKN